jgi:two-component system sensor histidine kinase ChvG
MMITSDLKVYKEIGRANGRFYPEVVEALDGKTTALMLLAKRRKIVSVATPIVRGDKVRGVLLVSTAPGEIDDVQAAELNAVLVLVLGATVAALLASFLLARTVADPVRQLSQYANEVTNDIQAAKDLPRFDERADEVGQLARSFALMTRALYRRIEASEKFAADVAHELKNPLTAARSTAESLIYVKTDQQRDEFIDQIQLELKRLNKLISDVADASRLDADLALQRFEPVQLAAVAENLVATFRDVAAGDDRHIELVVEPAARPDAYLVSGQDGRIEQVLTNLLSNALSFTPDGGTVTVRLRREGQYVDLVVEDQGPGIPPENIEKIFARFYTYRPTANASRGGNSGLGLAISREIVAAHGGQIWAENIWPDPPDDDDDGEPAGARFVIRLPAKAAARPAKPDRLSGGR